MSVLSVPRSEVTQVTVGSVSHSPHPRLSKRVIVNLLTFFLGFNIEDKDDFQRIVNNATPHTQTHTAVVLVDSHGEEG